MMSKAALLFGFSLAFLHATSFAQSFYEANPTYRDTTNDDATWTFATPAQAGLNERLLRTAGDAFAKERYSWSMLVVRHDAIVYERYFHGASKSSSNNIHSASKSIISALMGIAIDKGLIRGVDQPVYEFLPSAPHDLEIRHLLTMSSGIQWTEDNTEYQIEKKKNWVDAILNLPFPTTPGTKFLYSTALTHLMSAILTKATGMSTAEFAKKNLFDKIGIAPEHWGKDPQGINSGGYNFYVTPREMAKFGRLYMHGGNWKGTQVVSQSWVNQALSKQINARPGFDYGFNWWEQTYNGYAVKYAWGYGGQFIYLVPALDMVVVMTTNTTTQDPDFEGASLMKLFILPAASKR